VFNPVREYPILEDDGSPRGSQQSYRTFYVEGQHCASILLLNSNQNLNDILKDKFALKADDTFTADAAFKQIKKALYDRKKCSC
jgi:hypothetical protein